MAILITGSIVLLFGIVLYMVASPLGGIILIVVGVTVGLVGISRYTAKHVSRAIVHTQAFSDGHVVERKCPYCAEFVKAEAILCRYCRSELPMLIVNSEITKELEHMEYKLLVAAGSGDVQLVAKLIEEGAAVNCQDERGESPLIKASLGNHIEVVKTLMKFKADPRIPNEQGYTAEDYARARDYRDLLNVLRGR